jgi:hypothetical protein
VEVLPNLFGATARPTEAEVLSVRLPRPFDGDDAPFDTYDAFVPAHLPDPGPFLAEADVLEGREHAAVHRLARQAFEAHGVYDATFGYNLARLNLDQRHENAGFRYARDGDELRAEFTPTTEFCPQSDVLSVGAFRALNDAAHEYDVVAVRVDPMHQRSAQLNARLEHVETEVREGTPVEEAVSD